MSTKHKTVFQEQCGVSFFCQIQAVRPRQPVLRNAFLEALLRRVSACVPFALISQGPEESSPLSAPPLDAEKNSK
ncbi:hypothetical protein [uncultured Desulfovibrio sp.]|uniref:hypothetical protein n=1 Tax=uncultured Desulfovibrio sp. TaxID=167968 RepID=UPI00261A8FDF|nr:hypothetical protein [uncultured Desulfovibrio sp.]